ncbi:hypothetical protein Hanom_Chr11g01019651 [Helianthus anomalus]
MNNQSWLLPRYILYFLQYSKEGRKHVPGLLVVIKISQLSCHGLDNPGTAHRLVILLERLQ